MSRIIRGAIVTLTAALSLTACGGGSENENPLQGGGAGAGAGQTIVVGSADFPENVLLAEIYAQALEAKGVKVERKLKIGAREVYYDQIVNGSIQVFPEYNGALLAQVDKTSTATSSADVNAALKQKLPQTLEILNPAAAEDKDSLVVTQETASRHNLKSIEDLTAPAKDMIVGGPPEFKTRKQGLVGIEDVYGVTFKEFKSLDTAGPITVANLRKNQIQAANLFTTDPAIAGNRFVVLEDPQNVFGAQNVVPLVYKSKVDATARAALNAISAKLTTRNLLDMNTKMAEEKADPEDVAQEWLNTAGLA